MCVCLHCACVHVHVCAFMFEYYIQPLKHVCFCHDEWWLIVSVVWQGIHWAVQYECILVFHLNVIILRKDPSE